MGTKTCSMNYILIILLHNYQMILTLKQLNDLLSVKFTKYDFSITMLKIIHSTIERSYDLKY